MRFLIAAAVTLACGCGGLDPCDIRQSWCQDDIYFAVLDARADTWDAWAEPPESRVIGRETYRQLLEAGFSSSVESYDVWDEALTLVGMVDPDADLVTATIDSRLENTVAFYSPVDRTVTIIDHGEPTQKRRDTQTLAHEYVHSLQDRYDGLFAIEGSADTSDAWFAARSMVEGEAVLLSYLVILSTSGRGFEDVDWDATFDAWRRSIDEDVAVSPSRFMEALRRYVYPLGGQYMADVYQEGGTTELLRSLYHPPRSTRRVLDGPGRNDEPAEMPACLVPAPPGYELEEKDVLGPIGVHALLNDDADSALAWWAQSRTWRGDDFRVFRAGAETAVSWRVRWSSASRARAFLATLERRPLGWRLAQLDTEVLITAASDEALFDNWDPPACE